MIAGISNIISGTGANIRSFESGGDDNTRARIEVALDVRDRKQLEHIIARDQAHPRRLRYRARLQRLAAVGFPVILPRHAAQPAAARVQSNHMGIIWGSWALRAPRKTVRREVVLARLSRWRSCCPWPVAIRFRRSIPSRSTLPG